MYNIYKNVLLPKFFFFFLGGDFSGLPPLHMKPCWLPHSLNPRLSVLSHNLGEKLQDKIWNGNARFESGSLIPGPLQNSRLFVWQNGIGTGCHGIGLYFLCSDGVKTDDIQNSAVLSANGQRRQDTHMIYVVSLTPKPGFCVFAHGLCMRRMIVCSGCHFENKNCRYKLYIWRVLWTKPRWMLMKMELSGWSKLPRTHDKSA